MEKTAMWHPYPAEKPPKSGEYIITTAFDSFGIDCRHVTVGINWSQKHEAWNARDYADPDYALPNVVAWAYMEAFLPYMDGGDGRPVEMV